MPLPCACCQVCGDESFITVGVSQSLVPQLGHPFSSSIVCDVAPLSIEHRPLHSLQVLCWILCDGGGRSTAMVSSSSSSVTVSTNVMDLHCLARVLTTSLSRSLGASVHSVGASSTLASHAGELSTSPKLVGWTGTLGTGAGGSGKGGAVDDGTCAEILDGGAGAVIGVGSAGGSAGACCSGWAVFSLTVSSQSPSVLTKVRSCCVCESEKQRGCSPGFWAVKAFAMSPRHAVTNDSESSFGIGTVLSPK